MQTNTQTHTGFLVSTPLYSSYYLFIVITDSVKNQPLQSSALLMHQE